MKILIINKYENIGGAAIAANRLFEALKNENIDVNFLVQKTKNKNSLSTSTSFLKLKLNFLKFSLERLKILFHIKNRDKLFSFDSATFGEDISKNSAVRKADIIHLHWVNFGFLSLKSINNLLKLNKPIVWTFHDMWPFTGGCFYSNDCEKYTQECEDCPFLRANSKLAKKIFEKKSVIYKNSNLQIVALSNWIKKSVEQSTLLKDKKIIRLPNPIDTNLFKPEPKEIAREKLNLKFDKIYLGFIAFNVNDERKGAKYLKESLISLFKNKPELKDKIELIAIGKIKDDTFFENLPVQFTGYISDTSQMINYYNSFDLMLLPSLEDNVPLVIQEAMACETPLIAFNIGGIPDLIDHKINGYLAELKNIEDFSNGILYCIENKETLSKNAGQKVLTEFSNKIVAQKYINFYKSILK